jgi:hypothetical protein
MKESGSAAEGQQIPYSLQEAEREERVHHTPVTSSASCPPRHKACQPSAARPTTLFFPLGGPSLGREAVSLLS